ncbi:MAG: hypothetical protein HN368_19820 [Spirochaetales bacterium]|jgi:hypothetical protein|nr:hypothetical protein [Spirochaetales bacterium]
MKEKNEETDNRDTWYHGSPEVLEFLMVGSTITQDKEIARVFSHKPPIVSTWMDNRQKRIIKHSGKQCGYLYRIAGKVNPEDIYPHPRTTMEPGMEWLTRRELQVELLTTTNVRQDEKFTAKEIEELKRMANGSK